MSCLDLSEAANLHAVAKVTKDTLQEEITTLKARITRLEDVFFKLSTSYMHVSKKATDAIVEISNKRRIHSLTEEQTTAEIALLGLHLIASETDIREHYIKPNMDLLPPEIRIRLDELSLTTKS